MCRYVCTCTCVHICICVYVCMHLVLTSMSAPTFWSLLLRTPAGVNFPAGQSWLFYIFSFAEVYSRGPAVPPSDRGCRSWTLHPRRWSADTATSGCLRSTNDDGGPDVTSGTRWGDLQAWASCAESGRPGGRGGHHTRITSHPPHSSSPLFFPHTCVRPLP